MGSLEEEFPEFFRPGDADTLGLPRTYNPVVVDLGGKVEEPTPPEGGSPLDHGVPPVPSLGAGAGGAGAGRAAGGSPEVTPRDITMLMTDPRFDVHWEDLEEGGIPREAMLLAGPLQLQVAAALQAYVRAAMDAPDAGYGQALLGILKDGVEALKARGNRTTTAPKHTCPCCRRRSFDVHISFGSTLLICKTCSKRFSKLVKGGTTLDTLSVGAKRDRRLFACMDEAQVPGERCQTRDVPRANQAHIVPNMCENGLALLSGLPKKEPQPKRKRDRRLNRKKREDLEAVRVDRVVPLSTHRPKKQRAAYYYTSDMSGLKIKALGPELKALPVVALTPRGANGPLLPLHDPWLDAEQAIPRLTCLPAGVYDVNVDTSEFAGRCTWGIGVHVVVGESYHTELREIGDSRGGTANLQRLPLRENPHASATPSRRDEGPDAERVNALLKLVTRFEDEKSADAATWKEPCNFSSIDIREGAMVGLVVLTGRWYKINKANTIKDLRAFTRTFWVCGTPPA